MPAPRFLGYCAGLLQHAKSIPESPDGSCIGVPKARKGRSAESHAPGSVSRICATIPIKRRGCCNRFTTPLARSPENSPSSKHQGPVAYFVGGQIYRQPVIVFRYYDIVLIGLKQNSDIVVLKSHIEQNTVSSVCSQHLFVLSPPLPAFSMAYLPRRTIATGLF
jgi:hypothetical protein